MQEMENMDLEVASIVRVLLFGGSKDRREARQGDQQDEKRSGRSRSRSPKGRWAEETASGCHSSRPAKENEHSHRCSDKQTQPGGVAVRRRHILRPRSSEKHTQPGGVAVQRSNHHSRSRSVRKPPPLADEDIRFRGGVWADSESSSESEKAGPSLVDCSSCTTGASGGDTAGSSGGAVHDEKAVLKEWTLSLDGGRGNMLPYLDALYREFGTVDALAAAVLPEPISGGNLGSIEPSVWEALGVKPLGHKLTLAKGITTLSHRGEAGERKTVEIDDADF